MTSQQEILTEEALKYLIDRTKSRNSFMAIVPEEQQDEFCETLFTQGAGSLTPLPKRSFKDVMKGVDDRENVGVPVIEITFSPEAPPEQANSTGKLEISLQNVAKAEEEHLYDFLVFRIYEMVSNYSNTWEGRPKDKNSSKEGMDWKDKLSILLANKKVDHLKVVLRNVDSIPEEIRGKLLEALNRAREKVKFIIVTDTQISTRYDTDERHLKGIQANHDYQVIKM